MTGWNAAGRPALAALYGKQAVNLFQAVRANILELEPQTQRAYLRSKEDVYRELADLLVTAGRLPEAQQVLDFLKQEELRDYVRRDAEGGGAAGATRALTVRGRVAAAIQRDCRSRSWPSGGNAAGCPA